MPKKKKKKKKKLNNSTLYCNQTCYFDPIQNLNECEKKYEYTEMNLNLTTK